MAPATTARAHGFQQYLPSTPISFRSSGVARPPLPLTSLTMIYLRQKLFTLKKRHSVTIIVMAPLIVPESQKKSCFDTLHSNVYHLSNGDHKMADIVNMVMDEMPSKSNAAFK